MAFNPKLHPRGKGGKFINGLGHVHVHPNPTNVVGQRKPKGRGWKFKLGVGWYRKA